MSTLMDVLWLALVMASAAWLLSSAIVGLAARLVDRGCSPRAGKRRTMLIALLPWLVPALAVGAALASAALKSLGIIADHCLQHGLHHPHLCFEHFPALSVGAPQVAAVILGIATVISLIGSRIWSEARMQRQLNTAAELSAGRARLRRPECARPIAFTGGVWQPVVVMSQAFVAGLNPRERRIVLAHEVAHLRHGDLLARLLLEILLVLHLPRAAKILRRAWCQAAEEAADDAVAARYGREAVAATLLRSARLLRGSPANALSIAGADTLRRIHRQLHPPGERHSGWRFESVYIVGLLASIGASIAGHHLIETVLGLVAGY